MRRDLSQARRTISCMNDPRGTETIRNYVLTFLRTTQDASLPRKVRVFACQAVGFALLAACDERMLTEILQVLRRAIDEGDEPPLILLLALSSKIQCDERTARAVRRLGDRAADRRRFMALARITAALTGWGITGEPVPPRWIRTMCECPSDDEAEYDVLQATASWIEDERSDVDAVRDLIPNPAALVSAALART
jgi:hypothetical protein